MKWLGRMEYQGTNTQNSCYPSSYSAKTTDTSCQYTDIYFILSFNTPRTHHHISQHQVTFMFQINKYNLNRSCNLQQFPRKVQDLLTITQEDTLELPMTIAKKSLKLS